MMYKYDLSKKLKEYSFNDFKIKYLYDNNDNIVSRKIRLNNLEYNMNNTYNDTDLIIQTTFDNNTVSYQYDSLDRLIQNKFNSFTYKNKGRRTSLLIETITNPLGIFRYEYDSLNNITHIYQNGTLRNQYYYDKYNQLIREDDYITSKTIKYQYDLSGNILSKKICQLISDTLISQKNYEYTNSNWNDLLTEYDNKQITYDQIGNPLSIGNDSLTWNNGRQLASYNNIQFKYNKDGLRISKTIGNDEILYYLEESNILIEKRNNNVIYYLYSDVDDLLGFKYNDTLYYYIKNVQNDIIAITDSNNNIIAKYEYDSWGNIISIKDNYDVDITNPNHIALINPFRYRSYYYDSETNLYYLNSRYYSPEFGRFINADGIINSNNDILSYNLFIYSANNPINIIDYTGKFGVISLTAFGATLLKTVIVSAAVYCLKDTFTAIAGDIIGTVRTGVSKNNSKTDNVVSEPKVKSQPDIKIVTSSIPLVTTDYYEHTISKPCTKAHIDNISKNVIRGSRLTIAESINWVRTSHDVMCDYKFDAETVALGASVDGRIMEHQAHHNGAPGYYPHYHDSTSKNHQHIWYLYPY